MQDSNETGWASKVESATDSMTPELATNANDDNDNQSDGWQQYRQWISKAPAPQAVRTGVDPSVYTWKGYRSWAEQVKRNWSDS